MPKRRTFILTSASASTLLLSGCIGPFNDDSNSNGDNDDENETQQNSSSESQSNEPSNDTEDDGFDDIEIEEDDNDDEENDDEENNDEENNDDEEAHSIGVGQNPEFINWLHPTDSVDTLEVIYVELDSFAEVFDITGNFELDTNLKSPYFTAPAISAITPIYLFNMLDEESVLVNFVKYPYRDDVESVQLVDSDSFMYYNNSLIVRGDIDNESFESSIQNDLDYQEVNEIRNFTIYESNESYNRIECCGVSDEYLVLGLEEINSDLSSREIVEMNIESFIDGISVDDDIRKITEQTGGGITTTILSDVDNTLIDDELEYTDDIKKLSSLADSFAMSIHEEYENIEYDDTSKQAISSFVYDDEDNVPVNIEFEELVTDEITHYERETNGRQFTIELFKN